jgi:hypothetical protein
VSCFDVISGFCWIFKKVNHLPAVILFDVISGVCWAGKGTFTSVQLFD